MVTIMGSLGGILGTIMVLAFLLNPALGVLGAWNFEAFPANLWAQIIAFAIVVVSLGIYAGAKTSQLSKGIDVQFAFREIPPE